MADVCTHYIHISPCFCDIMCVHMPGLCQQMNERTCALTKKSSVLCLCPQVAHKVTSLSLQHLRIYEVSVLQVGPAQGHVTRPPVNPASPSSPSAICVKLLHFHHPLSLSGWKWRMGSDSMWPPTQLFIVEPFHRLPRVMRRLRAAVVWRLSVWIWNPTVSQTSAELHFSVSS